MSSLQVGPTQDLPVWVVPGGQARPLAGWHGIGGITQNQTRPLTTRWGSGVPYLPWLHLERLGWVRALGRQVRILGKQEAGGRRVVPRSCSHCG